MHGKFFARSASGLELLRWTARKREECVYILQVICLSNSFSHLANSITFGGLKKFKEFLTVVKTDYICDATTDYSKAIDISFISALSFVLTQFMCSCSCVDYWNSMALNWNGKVLMIVVNATLLWPVLFQNRLKE